MALIVSGTDPADVTFLELPNHYVIGGHLYKKDGLTPVPGGVFALPGVHTGAPRCGMLYGHAAGRGMYEDPFFELGEWYPGASGSAGVMYDMIKPVSGYTRAEQPRPFIMDTAYPQYCYILTNGTHNPRRQATAPASTFGATQASLTNTGNPERVKTCTLLRVDLQTNKVVWEADPGCFFPDFYIIKQDDTYLHWIGSYRPSPTSQRTVVGLGTIHKVTGAVLCPYVFSSNIVAYSLATTTLYAGTTWTSAAAVGYITGSSRVLSVVGGLMWLVASSTYASSSTPVYNYRQYFDFNSPSVTTGANPGQGVYSNMTTCSVIGSMRSKEITIGSNTYTYGFTYGSGNASTDFGLFRERTQYTPFSTMYAYPFYNFDNTSLFVLPIPPAFLPSGGLTGGTASVWGHAYLEAFERDTGGGTIVRYVLVTHALYRTCSANDDLSVPNYFVRLDVENDATTNISNKATLVATFYDSNYGKVWIDELTFMTVSLNKVRVYKIDLENETVVLLKQYNTMLPDNQIAYAAVDTSKNIWYVERTMPSKSFHYLFFETAYVVSTVEVNFQILETEYTGTDISTNVEIATRNNLGDYLESDVKLVFSGPAKFVDNNLTELTVTTLTTGVLVVPIVITGPGYVNCTGTVVS